MTMEGLPAPAEISESPPPAGPPRARRIGAIAVGAYTDIVGIYGPAEAAVGEQVSIRVDIKNTYTGGFYIASTAIYEGTTVTLSPGYAGVDPGATASFTFSFTMPNKDITLDIWSWYWTGTEWQADDHEAVVIKKSALVPQFSAFGAPGYV